MFINITFIINVVPEVTNAYDQLILMRKQLGWVTDIPRHGPGTREAMEKIKDFPEIEQVNFYLELKYNNYFSVIRKPFS